MEDKTRPAGYIYVAAAFVGYAYLLVALSTRDAASQYFAFEGWLKVFPYCLLPLLMMFCFLFLARFNLELSRGRRAAYLLMVSIKAYASLLCIIVIAAIVFWIAWLYLNITVFHNGFVTSDMA